MCEYVSEGQGDQFNSEGRDWSSCITIFSVPLSALTVDGCTGLRAGQQVYPHLDFMLRSNLYCSCCKSEPLPDLPVLENWGFVIVNKFYSYSFSLVSSRA